MSDYSDREFFPDGHVSSCAACPFRDWGRCNYRGSEFTPETLDQPLFDKITFGKGQFTTENIRLQHGALAVIRGALKHSISLADGRTQAVGFKFPGDLVQAFAPNPNQQIRVKALVDTELCHIHPEAMSSFRREQAEFSAMMEQIQQRELLFAREHMVTLGRRGPIEKLAVFLLEMHRRARGTSLKSANDEEAQPFTLLMTRGDIGDYLGLESETVSRLFSRLKSDGLITLVTPSRIVINNIGALSDLSEVIEPSNGSERVS